MGNIADKSPASDIDKILPDRPGNDRKRKHARRVHDWQGTPPNYHDKIATIHDEPGLGLFRARRSWLLTADMLLGAGRVVGR